ncbi:hypothetical protein CkaCkLH20_04797 [Colletotrichum karsti]|uniref:Uncharacterized protein n=1 Tax=Colletotrichum karsti TaxID=1095194 RepID=A0A9P6I696_9PEZI|nr:uncharacterized protein CkaCkLH20_04797 [Colletotrichum karsti]KAF9877662.1 hypothetical protein CkaCkLH20_04797 [Colletotrichum karsti]
MSNQYAYYTPPHLRTYASPQQQHPSASSSASRAAAAAAAASMPITEPSFTPSMRDRQARGKDPYTPHDSPTTSDMEFDPVDSPSRGGGGGGRLGHLVSGRGDSFEDRRQKAFAIEVLDDPEKLAMYACSRGDSIPGTRLYFTRILCGVKADAAQHAQDYRKAKGARQDNRRRSAGGDRIGRH